MRRIGSGSSVQSPSGYSPAERGDTLVELLIAVVIIALTATALLDSLTTSIQASGEHRALTTIDTLLKSYAETAKYQIQLGSPPLFVSCNASNTAPPTYTVVPPAVTGYSVTMVSVLNWHPAPVSAFDTSCSHVGIQQITIKATQSATGVNDSMSFVVTDPRYPQGS